MKIEVDIELQNQIADTYAAFGWELVDAQEIDTRQEVVDGADVTMYGDGLVGSFMQGWTGKSGKVKVKTHTVGDHYILLEFQRDKSMKDYDRLKALESKYESNMSEYSASTPKKPFLSTFFAIGIFAVFIIILVGMISSGAAILEGPMDYVTAIGMPLIGALLTVVAVLGWVKYPKQSRLHEEYLSKAADAVVDAREILGK